MAASSLILPAGVEVAASPEAEVFPPASGRGMIVNETDLPDQVIETYIEENASVLGLSPGNTYATYIAQGSLLTRPKFRVPTSVMEEIILARDLAERDDDVSATIGAMVALAFGDGMQNAHEDEVTVAMFDKIARKAKLLGRFKEAYREYLIAAQCTIATVMIRESISFTPMGADRQRTRSVLSPRIAIIPAEQIHVLGNDLFGTASLAYRPFSGRQEAWLIEFFNAHTTAARKAEMRRQDPVLTTLLTEMVAYDNAKDSGAQWVYGDPLDPVMGHYVWMMNPALVQRVCMPKGQWAHPRPLLARNFPLLEAKRLLSILDYSLLEAGANFLIVAKKGTDLRPALPEEIANLRDTLRRASRSGVMVGDHRLDIEIITPKLDELLNPAKRKLLGRKLSMAILRLPDFQSADSGSGQSVLTDTEIISRVVASDRRDLSEMFEDHVYEMVANANGESVTGPATIWFPKIILQGLQFFTQLVLGLRDRGDIPRKYAVEAAGFNYTAAVQQRKLEKSSGDDKILTPPPVPFSTPNGAPGEPGQQGGRPAGSGPDNGAPGARPSSKPAAPPSSSKNRPGSEEVRAIWEGETLVRVGAQTYDVLESFLDTKTIGRITRNESTALRQIAADPLCGVIQEGPFVVVPVNPDHDLDEIAAVRLEHGGPSLLVGRRVDGALIARALVFREPCTPLDAEETALRWGFDVARDDS